jgi:hypothetical protein
MLGVDGRTHEALAVEHLRRRSVDTQLDLTVCPECAAPAEIERRSVLQSTDGPVEHAKVLCVNEHWFMLPVAFLAEPSRGLRRLVAP